MGVHRPDQAEARRGVHAIQQDVPFTRAIATAVNAELEALATWLGLASVDRENRPA